jgi:hypothetical protein
MSHETRCSISDAFQAILSASLAMEIAEAIGMQEIVDNLENEIINAVNTLASMPEDLFTEDELEFLSTAYGANQ